MVGLNSSKPDSKELMVGFSQNVPSNTPTDPSPSRMSAPAQKARPAPVMMATQASLSPRNRSQAAFRSWRSSPLMALSDLGRLRVMVATWPESSYSTVSVMAGSCLL